jgi:hypothetical protein
MRFQRYTPGKLILIKLIFQTAGIGSDYAEYPAKHICAEV